MLLKVINYAYLDNIVGGLHVDDRVIDLAVIAAMLYSDADMPIFSRYAFAPKGGSRAKSVS